MMFPGTSILMMRFSECECFDDDWIILPIDFSTKESVFKRISARASLDLQSKNCSECLKLSPSNFENTFFSMRHIHPRLCCRITLPNLCLQPFGIIHKLMPAMFPITFLPIPFFGECFADCRIVFSINRLTEENISKRRVGSSLGSSESHAKSCGECCELPSCDIEGASFCICHLHPCLPRLTAFLNLCSQLIRIFDEFLPPTLSLKPTLLLAFLFGKRFLNCKIASPIDRLTEEGILKRMTSRTSLELQIKSYSNRLKSMSCNSKSVFVIASHLHPLLPRRTALADLRF